MGVVNRFNLMNRRNWIKKSGLLAGTALAVPRLSGSGEQPVSGPALTIAHITDVHLRPENGVPDRFLQCLEAVKSHKVDFFLNGGDTINAADYDDITRERVLEQWDSWDACGGSFAAHEVYSCLGNHDMWWAAPDEKDPMYGKDYVVQRLNMPGRYYSFVKKGWHFIVLDGNNSGIVLDEEQFTWLEQELENVAADTPVLLMSHYPVMGVTGRFYPHDQHSDFKKLTALFYKHREKVKVCLSGHMHLLDSAVYNGVNYFCNGAMSGYWWGEGNELSAGSGYYHQTPPGYAILKLYENGQAQRDYYAHGY
ncbi:MAG: metallophosphoesterase [Balneolales bacterium]